MLAQFAYRSGSGGNQVLRSLLVVVSSSSSHSQQEAAAVVRAFSTADDRGPARRSQSSSVVEVDSQSQGAIDDAADRYFDAARWSAPLRVHQLIGDPRTGIADDTTTAPFNNDVQVQHLYETEDGTDWFRYSMAGDQLPFMYMDSRLSDHSKNMLYMLRCKDPRRWTIPALAKKFRIRRQRVMAILALKEIQSHKIQQGASMPGPLQSYVFKVPLRDFKLDASGQPVDLLTLVQQQETAQQQQGSSATAAAAVAAAGGPFVSAEGLGSLQDFLAPDRASQEPAAAAATQPAADSSSSSGLTAADQQADLAVLMPQVAFTAQQLQLQLLQLLQQHHFSIQSLQQQLLHQVDVAEAYYKNHVRGTPLEQLLLRPTQQQDTAAAAATQEEQPNQQEDAAAEGAAEGEAATAAAAAPVWLDFNKQRQLVTELLSKLEPLVSAAGPQQEQEAGQLLVQLQAALQQAPTAATGADAGAGADAAAAGADTTGTSDAAAAGGGDTAASPEQQQQSGVTELTALVSGAPAATLAAAFNALPVSQRQQLLDLVPSARTVLNIAGTDLRAALDSSSSGSSEGSDNSSGSSEPGVWPGQVPALVDVWGFEEVSQQALTQLQEALPDMQSCLAAVEDMGKASDSSRDSSSGSSSRRLESDDIRAVQQAVQVYSSLLFNYDQVLTQQAVAAVGNAGGAVLPPSSQRRLARILRELDPAALEKLLLWESVFKEAAREGDSSRLRRLKHRVADAVKALNAQTVEAGGTPLCGPHPDLPSNAPAEQRFDNDLWAAKFEAEVVGRQFHRGSGDRPYISVPTYPKFEGLTLEEFDATAESEVSIINRLAADRQDNLMWKEYRTRLLRNMGLLAPDLHAHTGTVKPPKPAEGWSWVVHPMGGSAKAYRVQQFKQQERLQWLDEDEAEGGAAGQGQDGQLSSRVGAAAAAAAAAASWGQVPPPPSDPARDPAPLVPYVAEPGGGFRQLNEEESLVVGDTRPKPRRRWFTTKRG